MMTRNSLDIVIRFSSLGDIVLCSAFIEKLARQKDPHQIIFATQSSFRDIVSTFKQAPHKIWALPSSSLSVFFKTWGLLNSEHSQRPLHSLRVYDLHGVPKSFFLKCAAFIFALTHGIDYVSSTTSKKSIRRWLTLLFKKDLMGQRHVYAEHQKLITSSPEILLPQLTHKHSSPHYSQDRVKKILIAPDSQHWKKKWPVTLWEEFFRLAYISIPNAEYTLVGGIDVFPMDFLDQLKESYGQRFQNKLGQLPLVDLPRIAAEHDLTLCGNSAWQHISESVSVPVISLPGPIVKGFGFSPFLEDSRELEVHLNCRPCTRHGGGVCHMKGDNFHACMKRISPELLLKNTKELLRL
ncbi:MAG: glycosyltransferase family 9 protein [Bdellovibrionota bacterium]